MQRQEPPPLNSEQRQEPYWELATYARRMGAWALDFVGFTLTFILLIIALIALALGIFLSSETAIENIMSAPELVGDPDFHIEPEVVEPIVDEASNRLLPLMPALWALNAALGVILLGYIVWWLFALGRGQTPGKQIVGIRVIKDDGAPSGWGYTFLREFVIKFLLVGFLAEPTLGLARLVDYLWPLWDRAEKMQTLHDKMLGTIVVRK